MTPSNNYNKPIQTPTTKTHAKTLSLVSSVGVRGGGGVCGESGRVIGEAREECLEVWCSVWWLGEGVLVGVGDG